MNILRLRTAVFTALMLCVLSYFPIAHGEIHRMRHHKTEHFIPAWGAGDAVSSSSLLGDDGRVASRFSDPAAQAGVFYNTYSWKFALDHSKQPPLIQRSQRLNDQDPAMQWGVLPEGDAYSSMIMAHGRIWIFVQQGHGYTLYRASADANQARWTLVSSETGGAVLDFYLNQRSDPVLIVRKNATWLMQQGVFTGGGKYIIWDESQKISQIQANQLLASSGNTHALPDLVGEFDLKSKAVLLAFSWDIDEPADITIQYRISLDIDKPYSPWSKILIQKVLKLKESGRFFQYQVSYNDKSGVNKILPDLKLTYTFDETGEVEDGLVKNQTKSGDSAGSGIGGGLGLSFTGPMGFVQAGQDALTSVEMGSTDALTSGNQAASAPTASKSVQAAANQSADTPSNDAGRQTSTETPGDSQQPSNNNDKSADQSPAAESQAASSNDDSSSPEESDSAPQQNPDNPQLPDNKENSPKPNSNPEKNPDNNDDPGEESEDSPSEPELDQPQPKSPDDKNPDNDDPENNDPSEPNQISPNEASPNQPQPNKPQPNQPEPDDAGESPGSSPDNGGESSPDQSKNDQSDSNGDQSGNSPNSPQQSSLEGNSSGAGNAPGGGDSGNGDSEQEESEEDKKEKEDQGEKDKDTQNQQPAEESEDKGSAPNDKPEQSGNDNNEQPNEEQPNEEPANGNTQGIEDEGEESSAKSDEETQDENDQGGNPEYPSSGNEADNPSVGLPDDMPDISMKALGGSNISMGKASPVKSSGGIHSRVRLATADNIEDVSAAAMMALAGLPDKKEASWWWMIGLFLLLGLILAEGLRRRKSKQGHVEDASDIAENEEREPVDWREQWIEEVDKGEGNSNLLYFKSEAIAAQIQGNVVLLMNQDGRIYKAPLKLMFNPGDGNKTKSLAMVVAVKQPFKQAQILMRKQNLLIFGTDEKDAKQALHIPLPSGDKPVKGKKIPFPSKIESIQRLFSNKGQVWMLGSDAEGQHVLSASTANVKSGKWNTELPLVLDGGQIAALSSGCEPLIAGIPRKDMDHLWVYKQDDSSAKRWQAIAKTPCNSGKALIHAAEKRCVLVEPMRDGRNLSINLFPRDEQGHFTARACNSINLPHACDFFAMEIIDGNIYLLGRDAHNSSMTGALMMFTARIGELLKNQKSIAA